MLLISACLAGVSCKYNGQDNCCPSLAKMVGQGQAIPICPEQLGGLATPRLPAEIKGGTGRDVLTGQAQVLTKDGLDVTDAFCRGAAETLRLALLIKCQGVILKDGSPSCGSNFIYDGSFADRKKEGEGVTGALLRQHGFQVFSEKDFSQP